MKKLLLMVLFAALLPRTAKAEELWTGSQAIDWGTGTFVQVEAAKFANLNVGDALVFHITFTGGTDWPQLALSNGGWTALKGAANTPLAAGMTEVRYNVLSGMLAELQATGLVVSGIGFTLTAIERVEGDGGDYSHAVWFGETTMLNDWSVYQQLAASCFADAQVGQLLRVKIKDVKAGAYMSLRNPVDGWPDLSDTEGVYVSGAYQQFTITSAMLKELQANGLVVSGTNYTLAAVELWNASELRPLTLSVPVTGSWVYAEAPAFTVHVVNPYAEAVTARVVVEVATDKMEPVATLTKSVSVAAKGTEDVVLTMSETPAPGFYHATATVNDDLARAFYFGVNPTQIVSAPDKQADYDAYWDGVKAQLDATPINAQLTEIPSRSTASRKVYLVEMNSVADGVSGEPVVVRGYYAEPTDGKKHPVIMHYMGYDSGYRPGGESDTPWCPGGDDNKDYAEFYFSTRGQSVNNRQAKDRMDGIDRDFTNDYGDWFAYAFGQKDSYYYRGAYMDVVRAIDFMAQRETSDMDNLFAEGQSQGGALTYAAAALSGRPFRAIAPAITFMGDFPDYFELTSWPAFVAREQQGTMTDAELYAFLSYFDTKNLATRVTCPVITSIGLQDNVCPPHTNIAPYNNLPEGVERQVVYNPELMHQVNNDWYTTYMNFFEQHLNTEPSGIRTVAATAAEQPVYNLQGQRLAGRPVRGLFIQGGRKYAAR